MQHRTTFGLGLVALALLATASCGGGAGGPGAGQGLVLVSFRENAVDNVPLNQRLEFRFSEPVQPGSISPASLQIREGNAFGLTVPGSFHVQGATVTFEPRLASLCDQSDSGFKPGTRYRVQLIGSPEEFAIRNLAGQTLRDTGTFEFITRSDTDPNKYTDQIPGVGPTIVSTSPADGDAAVPVVAGNRIEIVLSENVDPCSVSDETVLVDIYELGDPAVNATAANGRASGFSSDGTDGGSAADQAPGDPTTWGAVGSTSFAADPRRMLCDIHVVQDFNGTRIVATPLDGLSVGEPKFPENALIVVRLTFDIRDFGHLSITPTAFSFTTENLALASGAYAILNDGETAYEPAGTTAVVDPDPRAPSRAQGFLLFSGDGDNGADMLRPSLPKEPGSGCTLDRQPNDGLLDDLDAVSDMVFDTGGTPNTCPNETDGSNAVVWEFASFRIRSGATVRFIGVNPAIILVQGDVLIENGGRLLLRGDGQGGMPRGAGRTGYAWTSNATAIMAGGEGVAGAGDGGDSTKFEGGPSGKDGFTGYGSPDGQGVQSGHGAGQGGTAHDTTYPSSPGTAQGGGGGGHAGAGVTASNVLGNTHKNQGPTKGGGGFAYPTDPNPERMARPSAGAGGGGGGNEEWDGTYDGIYSTGGGSGGAGGGFLDLTANGTIVINGTIDAAGSAGGSGGSSNYYAGPGGGGGGSGGGIRLLTPNQIIVTATATITAAGGAGGVSPNGASGGGGPQNHGGAGSDGRIVLEDGDSVISGLATATVTPSEGQPGFYRGVFDPGRFQGGGLVSVATSKPFAVGAFAGADPTFREPIQVYGTQADFKAGIPATGVPSLPQLTAILVEARGYQMKADGTIDLASETAWVSIGSFRATGAQNEPLWVSGRPGDIATPAGNTGGAGGFAELNALGGGGHEFLAVRFTFFMPDGAGPFDPGGFIDDWTIRYETDN